MPVQYASVLAEARAVRSAAGIFDVSHMGRFAVDGLDARALLDWVHTADVGEAMPVGRARYGLLCNESGGIIDDAIVYRLGEERFMIVANAANAAKVFAWLGRWRGERFPGATLTDRTPEIAMIALQGPDGTVHRRTGRRLRPRRSAPVQRRRDGGHGRARAYRPHRLHRRGRRGDHARVGDRVRALARPDGRRRGPVRPRRARHAPAGSRPAACTAPTWTRRSTPSRPGWRGSSGWSATSAARTRCAPPPRHGTPRVLAGFRTAERGPAPRAHHRVFVDGADAGEVTSGELLALP